jgi:2-C-methyl-D-erythritol 2,4-cyclodiphosphate synthase
MTDIRIGHGYDVHAFKPGDFIVIGGVKIPHNQALLAHSDGDVLLHAVCDAMLGALGLGDIGQHFPDSDARYKGINSRELVRHVMLLLSKQHYRVSNIDITIIAQAPKMAAHTPGMRHNLAQDLALDISRINVKATTTERLGFTGREEGIAVHAVVLLAAVEPK